MKQKTLLAGGITAGCVLRIIFVRLWESLDNASDFDIPIILGGFVTLLATVGLARVWRRSSRELDGYTAQDSAE